MDGSLLHTPNLSDNAISIKHMQIIIKLYLSDIPLNIYPILIYVYLFSLSFVLYFSFLLFLLCLFLLFCLICCFGCCVYLLILFFVFVLFMY